MLKFQCYLVIAGFCSSTTRAVSTYYFSSPLLYLPHIRTYLVTFCLTDISNCRTVPQSDEEKDSNRQKNHVGFPNRLYVAVKLPKLPKGPIPLYKLIRIKRIAQFQSKGPSSFRFEDGPFSQTVPFSRLNNHWETF